MLGKAPILWHHCANQSVAIDIIVPCYSKLISYLTACVSLLHRFDKLYSDNKMASLRGIAIQLLSPEAPEGSLDIFLGLCDSWVVFILDAVSCDNLNAVSDSKYQPTNCMHINYHCFVWFKSNNYIIFRVCTWSKIKLRPTHSTTSKRWWTIGCYSQPATPSIKQKQKFSSKQVYVHLRQQHNWRMSTSKYNIDV